MWCHIPYLFPVLGVVLFWVLPWQAALPAYLVLVAVSAIYGWATVQTLREPVQTGREAMIGAEGTVIQDGASPVIRVGDELWNARSHGPIVTGELVRVVGLEGLRLRVEPARKQR